MISLFNERVKQIDNVLLVNEPLNDVIRGLVHLALVVLNRIISLSLVLVVGVFGRDSKILVGSSSSFI